MAAKKKGARHMREWSAGDMKKLRQFAKLRVSARVAAQKLGRSPDWLYRHGSELPFVVRDGRLLRFSEQGIEEYIKRRMTH